MATKRFAYTASLASSLKATLTSLAGQRWNQALAAGAGAYEAYDVANWTTTKYLIPVTEDVPGEYYFTIPAALPGTATAPQAHVVMVRLLPTGSATGPTTDPVIRGPARMGWNGAAEVDVVGGMTGIDLGVVANPTATVNATGVVVGTTTTLTNKTGFGLSGTQTFNNTGTWSGNITGSVGSVTGSVTVTGPTYVYVNAEGYSNGVIVIRKGDSYGAVSTKRVTIPQPTGAVWPSDLASVPWVVAFEATKINLADGTATSTTGPITCIVNSATSVEVPLTAAQTAALVPHVKDDDDVNGWTWELQASTGTVVPLRNTLVSGTMTLLHEMITG